MFSVVIVTVIIIIFKPKAFSMAHEDLQDGALLPSSPAHTLPLTHMFPTHTVTLTVPRVHLAALCLPASARFAASAQSLSCELFNF